MTVAVIGDAEVEALPIIEIVPKSDFYDFESKYAPGGSQHLCPAPLSDETTRMVQELAVRAHRALSCEGCLLYTSAPDVSRETFWASVSRETLNKVYCVRGQERGSLWDYSMVSNETKKQQRLSSNIKKKRS